MRNFLFGILLLPALVGGTVIYHTLIDSKPDMFGQPITNRLARVELVWLAMNKPKLFVELFPQLGMDVEARHGVDERLLTRAGIFDPEFFATRHPAIAQALGNDPEALKRYWLTNQDKCLQGAPHFDVRAYLERYPDIARAYDGDCRLATLHWIKWGKAEGRNPLPLTPPTEPLQAALSAVPVQPADHPCARSAQSCNRPDL